MNRRFRARVLPPISDSASAGASPNVPQSAASRAAYARLLAAEQRAEAARQAAATAKPATREMAAANVRREEAKAARAGDAYRATMRRAARRPTHAAAKAKVAVAAAAAAFRTAAARIARIEAAERHAAEQAAATAVRLQLAIAAAERYAVAMRVAADQRAARHAALDAEAARQAARQAAWRVARQARAEANARAAIARNAWQQARRRHQAKCEAHHDVCRAAALRGLATYGGLRGASVCQLVLAVRLRFQLHSVDVAHLLELAPTRLQALERGAHRIARRLSPVAKARLRWLLSLLPPPIGSGPDTTVFTNESPLNVTYIYGQSITARLRLEHLCWRAAKLRLYLAGTPALTRHQWAARVLQVRLGTHRPAGAPLAPPGVAEWVAGLPWTPPPYAFYPPSPSERLLLYDSLAKLELKAIDLAHLLDTEDDA
jgi:hypothetical protein